MTVFCITACTHILEDISNKEQIKAQGRLVMKVGNESRTIMPSIGPDDIKTAVLTANGNEIKSWSGDNIISQIQNTDDILLDVGNYEFTMTFRNANGTDILTATTNQEIVPGDNTLHFDMKLITTGNGTGDISITLTWDVASGINKITAGLYYIATNEPLADFEDSELEITISNDETQTPTATYSPSGVPVGQYIIKFKVYNNPNIQDEKLLNTFPYVIKVAPGTTTSTQITLSKINTQYTITYNLSGGKWADGFTATEDRNANAKIILPTAENITKDGYEFGGWYDDDNNKITEIPSDIAQNISVTAKWLQLYTITYNLNGGENNTNNPVSYNVETETITLGIPTKNSSTFLGWYNENGEHITEITKGSTGNITVTASWRTTCTQSDVCEVIASLSGPQDILVTGSMHSNFIAEDIKSALNGNQNIKVNLDLSQTTGMNEITTYAFEGMSGLSSVILPDSVRSIGTYAFQDCSNLTSINIPYGVTSIETKTFNGCVSLTEIIIPDSVTSIAYDAFDNCYSVKTLVTGNGLTSLDYLPITSALESITIGDSITEIGDNKFYEFTNLKSVTFADNSQLTKIGENAFCDCSQLTEITIPDGVQTISKGAFGRTGFTSVQLPDSVIEMGTDIFSGCSNLETVTLSNSIKSIPAATFYECTNLTSIIIPEGVTSIGDSAFSHCSQLTSITFPESVTAIGINVFDACSELTSFIVHESNQNFSTLEDGKILCDKNKETLIAYPSAKGYVTILNGIKTIAGNAFVDCTELTDITIPNSVTSIGNGAFGRTGFTSVELPDSITQMGIDVFCGCSSLETVTLSNSITSIPKATFFMCYKLSEIVIPSSVTSIGETAFGDCYSVKTLVTGNGLTSLDYLPITSALESITIGDSITEIGDDTFTACNAVKTLVTGNGLTSLDNLPITSALESITIGDSITEIGDDAFTACNSVKTLVTGNGLESLDNLPITSALESITIGDSITEIDSRKFEGFTNLTSVTFAENSKLTTIGEFAFYQCTSLTNIDIPDSVTTIEQQAFNSCSSLESVEISVNATQLLESTFYQCTSLKSVIIPDSVTTVGMSVFSGCTNLESVKIGAGMTEINNFMFYDCKFTSIIIPVEIKTIGMGAFGDTANSQLKTVNYRGTEEDWNLINITPNYNGSLTSATINYNYTGE